MKAFLLPRQVHSSGTDDSADMVAHMITFGAALLLLSSLGSVAASGAELSLVTFRCRDCNACHDCDDLQLLMRRLAIAERVLLNLCMPQVSIRTVLCSQKSR